MKKGKLKNLVQKIKFESKEQFDNVQNGGKSIIITIILTFIVMVASCLAIFFMAVQGAEKVLVPNVVGKNLTDALLELQAKELYPKIQMKYSEIPGDRGLILEQNPTSGAIVKAYRRINLTVSRGVPIDFVEDYTGKNIDEVRNTLEFLFTGEDALIEIPQPIYRKDSAPIGSILAQYPKAGFPIDSKIKLLFVVSSGQETPKTSIPTVENLSLKQFLSAMNEYKLIFDWTLEEDSTADKNGTISLAENYPKEVEQYSRVKAILKIQPREEDSEIVQGIWTTELPEYPYPVSVRVDIQDADGHLQAGADFYHTGGILTLPYDVKKQTTLILYVLDEEYTRTIIE